MRIRIVLVLSALLLPAIPGQSANCGDIQRAQPPVSNGSWGLDEGGQLAVIFYDLDAPPKGEVEIRIVLRRITRPSDKIKPKHLLGHVGENVAPGKRRKVVWDFRREGVSGLTGDGWFFEIIADWGGDDYTVPTRLGSFTPPRLQIESLKFWSRNGDGSLGAAETGEMTFIVSNSGRGTARSSCITVTTVEPCNGIAFERTTPVGTIPPGGVVKGRIAIAASESVPPQTVRLRIEAADSSRYDSTMVVLEFMTRELQPPRLEVVESFYRTVKDPVRRPVDKDAAVRRGDTVEIFLKVKNTGVSDADSALANIAIRGDAGNVKVTGGGRAFPLKSPPPRTGNTQSTPNLLHPGDYTTISFCVVPDQKYAADSIVILASLTERRPRFSSVATIVLGVIARQPLFEERINRFLTASLYDSVIAASLKQIKLTPDSVAPYFFAALAYEQKKDARSCSAFYQKAADRGHQQASRWLKENRVRDVIHVSYRPLNPNPFAEYQGIIGLGLLKFSAPDGGGSDLATRLFDKLRSSPEVVRRFALYSYPSMDTLLKTLKLGTLDATDRGMMKELSNKLAVKFIVAGTEIDERTMTLRLIRTADGSVVLEKEFKTSDTSTALADAVLLFQSWKSPAYRSETVLEQRRK